MQHKQVYLLFTWIMKTPPEGTLSIYVHLQMSSFPAEEEEED